MRLPGVCLVSIVLAGGAAAAQDSSIHSFRKLVLTDVYFAEGASAADFDQDQRVDIVSGPYWYAGPDFRVKHEIYAPRPQDVRAYADNFFSFPHDLNGDGWPDVFVVGFPGTPAAWYENPHGAQGRWQRHEVVDWVSNESPHFTDLVGDGRPEVVCTRDGRFGYASIDPVDPGRPWKFTPISPAVADRRFGHGLGVGDVDGDGRMDVVTKDGWFRQPERLAGDWPFHPYRFTEAGGSQMVVYDVDGDGDGDIVTSLEAHGSGLAWFEQVKDAGEITFRRHLIMGSVPADNPYGVYFTELHALGLEDMDGDGLKDIVTGKTYWSHHTGTTGWHDGAVVYWFQLRREGGQVSFVPHEADDDSGIGRQVVPVDVNGDQLPDIVTAGMKGAFVLTHERRAASAAEAARAAPRPWTLPAPGAEPQGTLPRDRDGREKNLDFEDGTLKDWTIEGDAFVGQPVKGDINPGRKWGEGKKAGPHGDYWIGGFEKTIDDAPRGTLRSAAFVLSKPFASFLVGGGNLPGIRVEIVRSDSGKPIFVTHGRNDELMAREVVDVSAHAGAEVFLRLVDDEPAGWGHLNFDDFRLHDELPVFRGMACMPKRAH